MVFEKLQTIAKALMLPVAVLPRLLRRTPVCADCSVSGSHWAGGGVWHHLGTGANGHLQFRRMDNASGNNRYLTQTSHIRNKPPIKRNIEG